MVVYYADIGFTTIKADALKYGASIGD